MTRLQRSERGMTEKQLMNAIEAREFLGVGKKTFLRLRRRGVIPYHTDEDTGTKRYSRPQLIEVLKTLGSHVNESEAGAA